MAFFRKSVEEKKRANIKRVTKMSTAHLYETADLLLMQCGAAFDQFRYHDAAPEDVDECISALNEVWAEIRFRDNDGYS